MTTPLDALLEDDSATLEAALAFLNDWHDDSDSMEKGISVELNSATEDRLLLAPTSVAPSSALPRPRPAAVKTSAVRDRRRSTTARRNDELRQLQTEAAELTARLAMLRAMSLHKSLTESLSLGDGVAPMSVRMDSDARTMTKRVAVATLWKDMALRHKRLRAASDAENTRLRRLVADQRKAIASILDSLRRLPYQVNRATVFPIRSVCSEYSPEDLKMQGRLRLQVEQSSLAVLASLQLWSVVLPKSQVQQLSATKTSVVFTERHTMPFSYMEVATALWESTGQSCFKEDRFFEQRMTEKNGTLLRSRCMEYRLGQQHFKLRGNTAVRRTQDDFQGGFVFAGVFEPVEINGHALSGGISVREQGLAAIAKVEEGLCHLTILHEMEIETSPLLPDRDTHVNTLASLFASEHPASFHEMLHEIESVAMQRQTLRASV